MPAVSKVWCFRGSPGVHFIYLILLVLFLGTGTVSLHTDDMVSAGDSVTGQLPTPFFAKIV